MIRAGMRAGMLAGMLAGTAGWLCPAAAGQALATASGPGSNVTAGLGVTWFDADYGQRKLAGGVAFVDVHPTWRYGLEAEARVLRKDATDGVSESMYLAGPHVYLRSHRVRPYVKAMAGAGQIDFPFGYAKGTYFVYAAGAGVDVELNDRVSVRALDYEYQRWPQFTFGALTPHGWSAGVVFRLNRVGRYPRR